MRMYALYTNAGVPVTGLTLGEVVFTVKAIKRSDSSVTTPVNAQAATVDVGGGYYLYDYAAADFETYDYVWFAQYTGVTSVDSAYVYGNTDAIAGVDDLSGFTTAGKAEVQAEAEDALTAYGGAKTSDLSGLALDSTLTARTLVAANYALTGEAAAASSQGEAAAALATWVATYAAPLLRTLGLVQENQVIDTTTFDADDHMLTARIRTFTDATLTVVLATYNLTATYDVDGNIATFRVVKA